MTEEKNEQDLVKALDNIADAAASVGGVPTTPSIGSTQPVGAVASPFSVPSPVPPTPSIQTTSTPYLSSDASEEPVGPVTPDPEATATPGSSDSAPTEVTGPLADIKQDALLELRPLVGKLNVSPEEKFDTYLLLIRSTDDSELIAPAHEAAKQITDESRRAEALLDIIKEIDYLSNPKSDNA